MELRLEWSGIGELTERLEAWGPRTRARLREALRETQLELFNGIISNLGGSLLNRRTGTLSRSFHPIPLKELASFMSADVASSNIVYANIQERGGEIVPTNAENLTIPLEAMETSRGVARGSARDVIENPEAFGFSGTFFRNGVLFGTKERSRKGYGSILPEIDPLFVLKKSVTIPAHFYVRSAILEVESAFYARVEGAVSSD